MNPVDFVAVIALHDYLYLIGGLQLNVDCSSITVGVMQRFDTRSNTWEVLCPMLRARYNVVAATLHGKIYVFGSTDEDSHNTHYSLNTVECFNPVSNTWQTISPMPAPLALGSSVVTFGGTYCYIIEQDDMLDISFSSFDVSTNSWKRLPLPAQTAMWPFTSIVALRGSVLGSNVLSTGSNPRRWFHG